MCNTAVKVRFRVQILRPQAEHTLRVFHLPHDHKHYHLKIAFGWSPSYLSETPSHHPKPMQINGVRQWTITGRLRSVHRKRRPRRLSSLHKCCVDGSENAVETEKLRR